MLLKNKSLVAVMSCALMLAAAPLLPNDLSVINTASAREGGGHGGGNGGGNGGGHGGGAGGGAGGSHAGSDHADSNGRANGLDSDHAGKAVRDHGISGKHNGSERNDDRGHGGIGRTIPIDVLIDDPGIHQDEVDDAVLAGARTTEQNAFKADLTRRTLAAIHAEAGERP